MGYPTPIHVSMPVIDVFVQKNALHIDIVCLLVSRFFSFYQEMGKWFGMKERAECFMTCSEVS